MIKPVGALFIVISCACFGFRASMIPYKRYMNIKKIISVFYMIANEIEYTKKLIDDIFLSSAETAGFYALFYTASKMNRDMTAAKRWKEAVKKDANTLYLSEEDIRALMLFAEGLGEMNRAAQTAAVKREALLMEEQAKRAYEEYREKYRLTKSLGICIGLFTAIMLL